MEAEPRRRRTRWLLLFGFAGLLGFGLLLVGWNRLASSPGLCASCHVVRPAVATAATSVHAKVPCLACHVGTGLGGSLRYVPTLMREGLAQITPFHAKGVLKSRACIACHEEIRASPAPGSSHPAADQSSCSSCHGDVSHPGPSPAPAAGAPHPDRYDQTHGQDATDRPATCAQCHVQQKFCAACHFRATYPHPGSWISRHGAVEQQDPQACTLCHPTTFCAGCHGTEIPHRPDWLSDHVRALQDASDAPCYVCHPRPDCASCHIRHGVHREQDLYR